MNRLILIIDDDALSRRSLELILQSAGIDSIVAENGRKGIELFHSHLPGIVVTDLIMPEQDGIETILQIRLEAPETKIIAISGGARMGNSDYLSIATKLGADVALAKPIVPSQLIDAVRKCLTEG